MIFLSDFILLRRSKQKETFHRRQSVTVSSILPSVSAVTVSSILPSVSALLNINRLLLNTDRYREFLKLRCQIWTNR
jgi:hypothetical protein